MNGSFLQTLHIYPIFDAFAVYNEMEESGIPFRPTCKQPAFGPDCERRNMTHTRKTLLRACLCICMVFTLCASPALASYSARINNSGAKIYSASGKSGSLPAGTGVTVEAVAGSWAKISYKGAAGLVRLQYLTATSGVTGYAASNAALYKGASSSSGKIGTIPKGTKLSVVGVSGGYYQVTNGYIYGYVAKGNVSKTKPVTVNLTAWKSKVEKVNWYNGGSSILSKGEYAYILDIDTGLIVRIRCLYGSNHADVEPATKADTLKLLKIAGGSFSWDSHAVILRADGRYIAAAINTMPHGEEAITDNGYNGQFCLHLSGSKTHGSDTVNEEHQDSIQRAYEWARG